MLSRQKAFGRKRLYLLQCAVFAYKLTLVIACLQAKTVPYRDVLTQAAQCKSILFHGNVFFKSRLL